MKLCKYLLLLLPLVSPFVISQTKLPDEVISRLNSMSAIEKEQMAGPLRVEFGRA